jgi:hypothetical protein
MEISLPNGAKASLDGEASSTLPSKKPSVRKPLPDYLPLETVMRQAPCVCPTCGATKFGRIGADERMGFGICALTLQARAACAPD